MHRPLPLILTCAVVSLQAVALVVVAVLALANLGDSFAALGIGAAIFFLIVAAGLAVCVWALWDTQSWARAPVVLTQLIELGLAWDARHSATWLCVLLAVLAVLGLIGILHPASIEALADDPERRR